MDELVSVLLSVQGRIEGITNQIDSGALSVSQVGAGSADEKWSYLELLRVQRDDLDRAIALARNLQRKVY